MMAVVAVIVVVLLVVLDGRGLLAATSVMGVVGVVVVRVVLAFVSLTLFLGVGLVELVEHLLSLLHNLDKEELGGHLGIG